MNNIDRSTFGYFIAVDSSLLAASLIGAATTALLIFLSSKPMLAYLIATTGVSGGSAVLFFLVTGGFLIYLHKQDKKQPTPLPQVDREVPAQNHPEPPPPAQPQAVENREAAGAVIIEQIEELHIDEQVAEEDASPELSEEEKIKIKIQGLNEAIGLLEAERSKKDPLGDNHRTKEIKEIANVIYKHKMEKYALEAELETDAVIKLSKLICRLFEELKLIGNENEGEELQAKLKICNEEIQRLSKEQDRIEVGRLKEAYETAGEGMGKAEAGIEYFRFLKRLTESEIQPAHRDEQELARLNSQLEECEDKINEFECLKCDYLIAALDRSILEEQNGVKKIDLQIQILRLRSDYMYHKITSKTNPNDLQDARKQQRGEYQKQIAELILQRYDAANEPLLRSLEAEQNPIIRAYYQLSIKRNELSKLQFWMVEECLKPDAKVLGEAEKAAKEEIKKIKSEFAKLYLEPFTPIFSRLVFALLTLHSKVNGKKFTLKPEEIEEAVKNLINAIAEDHDALAFLDLDPVNLLGSINPVEVISWNLDFSIAQLHNYLKIISILLDDSLKLEEAKKQLDQAVKDYDKNIPAGIGAAQKEEHKEGLEGLADAFKVILGCRHSFVKRNGIYPFLNSDITSLIINVKKFLNIKDEKPIAKRPSHLPLNNFATFVKYPLYDLFLGTGDIPKNLRGIAQTLLGIGGELDKIASDEFFPKFLAKEQVPAPEAPSENGNAQEQVPVQEGPPPEVNAQAEAAPAQEELAPKPEAEKPGPASKAYPLEYRDGLVKFLEGICTKIEETAASYK